MSSAPLNSTTFQYTTPGIMENYRVMMIKVTQLHGNKAAQVLVSQELCSRMATKLQSARQFSPYSRQSKYIFKKGMQVYKYSYTAMQLYQVRNFMVTQLHNFHSLVECDSMGSHHSFTVANTGVLFIWHQFTWLACLQAIMTWERKY